MDHMQLAREIGVDEALLNRLVVVAKAKGLDADQLMKKLLAGKPSDVAKKAGLLELLFAKRVSTSGAPTTNRVRRSKSQLLNLLAALWIRGATRTRSHADRGGTGVGESCPRLGLVS